jgi:uncharacterized protein (TIGR00296 family)/AmmeMemoRadiSam system protein B
LKILLLFISFFFIFQLQGHVSTGIPVVDQKVKLQSLMKAGSCAQHNQLTFTHPLQYVDCKSHRTYPVTTPTDQIRIIVVPYGQDEEAQCLMAATYRILQGQVFDKIIVICSADLALFHGVALPCMIDENSLTQGLSIQDDVVEKLSGHRLFHYYQQPFNNNFSMQLQFVFLDFYLKNSVEVVPLMIGQLSRDDACEVAVLLASCCTPQTLIVVSADIACHQHCFHDCPLDQSKICKVYDQDACRIQAIQSRSLEQHVDLFDDGYNSSIFTVLFELLQLSHFQKLESDFVGYSTSSCNHAKNMEAVQSYGAFIFQSSQSDYKNHIGSYEQLQLLKYARAGLHSLFEVPVCRLPCMISYEMSQPHGVFASLYTMSDHGIVLRGCMGKVQSKIPLHDMMYQMTKQAACNDIRFYPLQQKDLGNTIISLSVITNFTSIQQCSEIHESDGVMLQYDDKEAVALPTKAPVSNWDHEAVLIHLSNQMGSHAFLWKKPRAKIFTFHSVVFQEE